jgi:uncharacterized protein (TIGR02996 family)
MSTDPLAPPRPELLALLGAVKDHPDEDTPRLVLADWLDEQDNALDAERASFIRKHSAAPPPSGYRMYIPPGEVPRGQLWQRWLGPIASFGGTFVRGLPVLACEVTRLLEPDVPALLAREEFAFIQHVQLTGTTGPRLEALVAIPEFCHVPGLRLFPPCGVLAANESARVLRSPNLTGLRRLDNYGMNPGAAGLRALASNPALARLRVLSIPQRRISDTAVAALARSKHLARLEALDLSSNSIGDVGAMALARPDALPGLWSVDLRANPYITARAKRHLRDRFGDRVLLD